MSLHGAQRQSNLAPAHQTAADLGADGTDKTIRYPPVSSRGLAARPVINRAMACDRARGDILAQLIEERLRPLEVLCAESLGEPTINRRQQIAGFGAALVTTEMGETHSRQGSGGSTERASINPARALSS